MPHIRIVFILFFPFLLHSVQKLVSSLFGIWIDCLFHRYLLHYLEYGVCVLLRLYMAIFFCRFLFCYCCCCSLFCRLRLVMLEPKLVVNGIDDASGWDFTLLLGQFELLRSPAAEISARAPVMCPR